MHLEQSSGVRPTPGQQTSPAVPGKVVRTNREGRSREDALQQGIRRPAARPFETVCTGPETMRTFAQSSEETSSSNSKRS